MTKQSRLPAPKKPPPDSPNTIARTFGLSKQNKARAKAYHDTLNDIITAMEQDRHRHAAALAHLSRAREKLDGFRNAPTFRAMNYVMAQAGGKPMYDREKMKLLNGRAAADRSRRAAGRLRENSTGTIKGGGAPDGRSKTPTRADAPRNGRPVQRDGDADRSGGDADGVGEEMAGKKKYSSREESPAPTTTAEPPASAWPRRSRRLRGGSPEFSALAEHDD